MIGVDGLDQPAHVAPVETVEERHEDDVQRLRSERHRDQRQDVGRREAVQRMAAAGCQVDVAGEQSSISAVIAAL